MDSTIFNRRTLLGSGALVGLGALLAACDQQANNEAAATASAAPSETASASAAALSHLQRVLPLNRRLLADTQDSPRHPMVSTVRQTATDPRRMSPSLVMSPLSILRPKKASIV